MIWIGKKTDLDWCFISASILYLDTDFTNQHEIDFTQMDEVNYSSFYCYSCPARAGWHFLLFICGFKVMFCFGNEAVFCIIAD